MVATTDVDEDKVYYLFDWDDGTDKYKKLKNLTSSFDNDWDNDKKEVYRNQLIKIIGDPRDSIISLSREEQDLIDKMIKFYNLKTPAEILSSPTHKTLKRSWK